MKKLLLILMSVALFSTAAQAARIKDVALSVLNQVIPENMHDNALTQACTMVTSPELGPSYAPENKIVFGLRVLSEHFS